MTYKIKFGTDGWREIIGKDYTVANVKRVAQATATWMVDSKLNQTAIMINHMAIRIEIIKPSFSK